MRFKSVIISFVLLTMALNIQAQQSSIVDGIIAKVGGEILLYSEWQEQIAYIKEKQAFLTDEDKCGILQNMLVQKFLIHQAKVDSLEVKDEEVDVQLNARIDQILNYMNNDFNKFEEYYGQPVSKVKERFREDIKNQLYTERMQGKITGNINLTPKEVEQFFKLIPKDSLPYLNAEVEIAELVVYPKINTVQEKTAKEKLEKISKYMDAIQAEMDKFSMSEVEYKEKIKIAHDAIFRLKAMLTVLLVILLGFAFKSGLFA